MTTEELGHRSRWRLLALVLSSTALVASCGWVAPSATGERLENVPAETLDGYTLGPAPRLSGDQFHRLEATARDLWRSGHPNEVLSGFEVRTAAAPPATELIGSPIGDAYILVVTVAGGARHALAIHCDPATFPAPGSCS